MKKIIAILLSLIFALSMISCGEKVDVTDETKNYEITSEIKALDIRIGAADFKIAEGDSFSASSNLMYLTVTENNGLLSIVDEIKQNADYSDAFLNITLPADITFDVISIMTGAAKMTADSLAAGKVSLKLGAGDVNIKSLSASNEIDITGGAGKITVKSGTLNDLSLAMGIGDLDMTATLLGSSDFKFGIGKADITVIGNKDDYDVEAEEGSGLITIDGEDSLEYESEGDGENQIEIKGGLGAITLNFCEK